MVEHECPRCHRAVELPLGALCRSCVAEIERRAARWGNRISLVTTIVLAVYMYFFRLSPDPTARLVSAMAIVIWFALSNIVVRRAVRELMR
ncbi:MAG: hypothetical protein HY700_09805 [Gemmatimonadetes bacterium]|nr:hypothetical protein [Gemmatimonadota bacterium]